MVVKKSKERTGQESNEPLSIRLTRLPADIAVSFCTRLHRFRCSKIVVVDLVYINVDRGKQRGCLFRYRWLRNTDM